MPLQSIADSAVAKVCETISSPIPDDERVQIARIIEQAVMDASVTTSQRCGAAVNRDAGADADLAHKIAEQIKRTEKSLIANLMGLR